MAGRKCVIDFLLAAREERYMGHVGCGENIVARYRKSSGESKRIVCAKGARIRVMFKGGSGNFADNGS